MPPYHAVPAGACLIISEKWVSEFVWHAGLACREPLGVAVCHG